MGASPPFIVTGTKGASKAPVMAGATGSPAWTDIVTEAELTTHTADTTAVHGITDTSVLETTTGSQAKVDTHAAAADPHTVYQKESEKAAASGYAGLDANIFVPAAQLARYRTAAPVAVGPSSSDEVTLINQTIPAGLLGVTGAVRCSIVGDFLNNHASTARQYTLRFYAGGTKIYDGQSVTIAVSTLRRPFFCETLFVNRNAQNSNRMSGICGVGGIAAATTGFGLPTTSGASNSVFSGIASDIVAIDTSAAWIFKVTLQLSASESTLDMRISQVLLEVL